ncbi:MAG: NAD-dependent epimerase/dehydratase family protein [Lachnospiraceae bacterium]
MKVLVLGGNGFIGRNLCRQLLSEGYEVYSFDMMLPAEEENGIHYIEGDFFDDYVLEHVTRGMDVIYHAICTLNPGNSEEKYLLGYERDFIQTVKLCTIVKKQNCRLIFLSSGGTVYGNQEVQPIPETATTVPINHYGNLKLCIENLIRTFNTHMDRKMIIARISNPYGPGQDYRKGVGFIDAALRRAMHGEVLEIYGDGYTTRDYIFITDACRMLASLIRYDGDQEIFNLSSGRGASQKEILSIIHELIPEFEVVYTPARSVDLKKIVLDNSRYLSVFPMELVPLEQGIKEYYSYIVSENNR